MIVGFTGTQKGMTSHQRVEIACLLRWLCSQGACEAHHGDCVGADEEFEQLAKKHGLTTYAHPASDTGNKRAYCDSDVILTPKPALKRNRDIVAVADVVIATPKSNEVLRSGTWATVRYARKIGKELHIILPKDICRA